MSTLLKSIVVSELSVWIELSHVREIMYNERQRTHVKFRKTSLVSLAC